MIEDAMLHYDRKPEELRAFVKHVRELRKRLDAATEPEEIARISSELDEYVARWKKDGDA